MPFTSTGISGVYSSSNWPPFTEGKKSFETQSFKPKSKNVIETVYTILGESLILFLPLGVINGIKK